MSEPADTVHWPTLRSKLWPVTVIRLPGWSWLPMVHFRNWYHGEYWRIEFGRWLIMGGACELKNRPTDG